MSAVGASKSPSMAHKEHGHNQKIARLTKSLGRLFPHRLRRECGFCCEKKLQKSFKLENLIAGKCRTHLNSICDECIRASLSAQLDCKPLLEIGCPTCSAHWTMHLTRLLLGRKDKKRFDELDILAKNRGLVPEQLPEFATLHEMLQTGTRFCPWCRFPFVKDGGCDYMSCAKCHRGFTIKYALVLEDGKGRRAAPIVDEYMDVDF